MLIQTVVVGIGHWEDLTEPFLVRLLLHHPEKEMKIFVVDNGSKPAYPENSGRYSPHIIRAEDTVGYGSALNFGAEGWKWDWLLCCNNDCTCEGNVTGIVSKLRTDTIYGNAWKFDYQWMADLHLPAVVDSAYLLIPRGVWDVVGEFDPQMDAAFEEIDYGLRAIRAGFRLDVAELPITHLNLHTRRELVGYEKRWNKTSEYFRTKHLMRDVSTGAEAQEVIRE
jgi:GT2 family glycosyltransferase